MGFEPPKCRTYGGTQFSMWDHCLVIESSDQRVCAEGVTRKYSLRFKGNSSMFTSNECEIYEAFLSRVGNTPSSDQQLESLIHEHCMN